MMLWRGHAFYDRLLRELGQRVTKACIHLRNEARITLSRPGRTGKLSKRNAQSLVGRNRLRVQRPAARNLGVNANAGFGEHQQFANRSVSLRFGRANKQGDRNLVGLMARSRPGEPPRRQTGQLRASVSYEIDLKNLAGRVGTNLKHGRYMELGVKGGRLIVARGRSLVNPETGQFFGKRVRQGQIKPRPWLKPTVQKQMAKVEAILGAPLDIRGNF